MRRRGVASRLAQFGSFVVILGMPNGMLGVLWPTMRHSLHRPLADLSELVAVCAVLYFVGSLAAERVHRALGLRLTLFASTVLGCAALAGWALSPSWWAILVSLALLGAAEGVLDAVLNAVAALDGGVRRLGLLHASWAIGGTLGPVVVATVAAGGDWRLAVAVVAVVAALLVPLAAATPASATRDECASELEATPPTPTGPHGSTRGAPTGALVATVLAFVVYTGAESVPISWGATYLVSDRRLSTGAAAIAMALFWGALASGRLALALPQRFSWGKLLEASCLLFVAGTALFWLVPGRLAVVGLPVAGLGSAAIFPLLVALTPDRLGEAATGRAVGYSLAGSVVGGPAAVALCGLLADHFGVRVLGPSMLVAAVAAYLAHQLLAAVAGERPLSFSA